MEGIYKRQIAITVFTVAIAIATVVGFGYFYSVMSGRETKVREVKTQLATYEQNKKIFAEENKELKTIEDRVQALEGYKITLEHVPQLLSSLEGTAAEKKVSFSISSVDTPKEGEEGKPLVILFSAGGSYEALTAFLDTLLHQSYQVRFTEFSFFKNQVDEAGKTTDRPSWELNATMEVLSF